MTIGARLLELLASWWGTRTAVRESVLPAPAPRVPGEYMALYTYLEQRYASKVVLTFDQVEDLLGFALPAAARVERDWWTRAAVREDRHADAWTAARRIAMPNLPARNVAFDRIG